MLVKDLERQKSDIESWLDQHGRDRSALLPVLQEIQKKYNCVSGHAMQVVAECLKIHPVEVYSVVSFYAFLDHAPKGKHVIRLCRTIACDMQGKSQIARQLENELGIAFGETTADGQFTLEYANCIGMCDQGPALLVNDLVYTGVTPAMVDQILEPCRKAMGVHALASTQEGHA